MGTFKPVRPIVEMEFVGGPQDGKRTGCEEGGTASCYTRIADKADVRRTGKDGVDRHFYRSKLGDDGKWRLMYEGRDIEWRSFKTPEEA